MSWQNAGGVNQDSGRHVLDGPEAEGSSEAGPHVQVRAIAREMGAMAGSSHVGGKTVS